MLALGFIAGSYLLVAEFKRYKLDPNIANNITLLALVAGVAGSKMLFLIENWSAFITDPFGMAFNPGGLTFYGGFLLAALSIYVYGKKKGIAFFTLGDAISPGLMLGYGIARLGCHLAGDGDYGFPTTLPWGTDYSKGTFPPSVAFKDFPDITSKFPGGIVPDNIPMSSHTGVRIDHLCTDVLVPLAHTEKNGTGREVIYDLSVPCRERTIYHRISPSQSKNSLWPE